jgi:uncharacterized membrane protein YgcG
MTKRKFCFITLLATILIGSQLEESTARSLYWQNLLVDATLMSNGELLVREEQTIVFTGDWNGGERIFAIRPGQTFVLTGIWRKAADDNLLPLTKGNLQHIDHWDWGSNDTLRWRSRLPGDPPFSATPITYVLEYRLGRILTPQKDGGFILDHDFAFPNRSGEIQHFRLTLQYDDGWQQVESPLVIEKQHLAPGQSVVYTTILYSKAPEKVAVYEKPLIPLRHADTGITPPAGWLRWGSPLALFGIFLVSSVLFYLHERRAQRFVKNISPDDINEEWLNEHVFSMLPETVGATWDKTTNSHEVAAILARLVVEGKMTSQLEQVKMPLFGLKIPGMNILHLTLQQPRSHFRDYERKLIDGLFIDGNTTDTKTIREYYRKKGKTFQPALKIRTPLEKQVKNLTANFKINNQNTWFAILLLSLVGLVLLVVNGFLHQRELPFTVMGGILGVFGSINGGVASNSYKNRSDGLIGRSLLVHLFPLLAILVFCAMSLVGISTLLTLALFTWYTSLIFSAFFLARSTDTPKGVKLCRNLTAARTYLQNELRQAKPAIKDEWFPYLLAFGLGRQVDQWHRQFSDRSVFRSREGTSFDSSSSSSGTSGFTGGGGSFGGAGASGAWEAAATSLGASSSSSSSSSGGGGGSSGGGGGGGW